MPSQSEYEHSIVARLRPKARRYSILDQTTPGLELRVAPSGTKSWSLRYRADGRQIRITLGVWPAMSVDEARRAVSQVKEGITTDQQRRELPLAGGGEGMKTRTLALPKKGTVKRYILTCAQNNTYVHLAAWKNLKALAEHYDAEIMVSRFSYNKHAYAQGKSAKPGVGGIVADQDLWYDHELDGYFSDERVELAPTLVWCGESNISPTAVRPLSGLEGYTGRKSAIFPHTKIALGSVASGKSEGVKILYTTGTVTQKNYIQRKAGLKAEFHHTHGALLAEVNSKGKWYCRQLNASNDTGEVYDLDLLVRDGKITSGHRVEAITFGDIHTAQLDPEVARLGWGTDEDSMMHVLKPREVHLHDLVDFRARTHHERGNCHLSFEKFVEGQDSVRKELEKSVAVVRDVVYTGSHVVVIQSNHDNALLRWLREADYRQDPPNALVYLMCQKRVYESIADQDETFHLLEWILRELGCPMQVEFLREDESYIICPEKSDGVECGMHGHDGANGSRGTPIGFNRMGRRANIGHSHSACILDGVFVAGTSSKLDMDYNTGPSSWTHSHIVTYPNGKRAIVTMYDGAWRAK